jgi:superfamily I DNA/RNA helicase
VDEYQDINLAQERLVLLLAPPGPEAEICAVGDPDQAIYGFRGADPACVHRFTARYPGAAVVALRLSYRCPAAVVHAATRIIERAPGRAPRPLDPLAPASPPIEHVCLAGEAEEAGFIAREIERAVGGISFTSMDAGRGGGEGDALAFHDVAVLFRTSAQAEAIALALDRGGIPHQRAGDGALTGRPEVAALVDRLRALADRAETGGAPVADLVRQLVPAEAGARARDAADLVAALAVPYGRDAPAFLAALPLWQSADLGLSAQKVALLTLHAAKGLEFPLVFIAGCQDGLLPLRLPGRPPADLEEERRLLYVGMTRARRRLVLTEARRRTVHGGLWEPGPCPFLEGLPPGLISSSRMPAARRRPAQQIPLL